MTALNRIQARLGAHFSRSASLALLGALLATALLTAPTAASAAGPEISVDVIAPDTITAGNVSTIRVITSNSGDQRWSGEIEIVDTLPADLSVGEAYPSGEGTCEVSGQVVTCKINVEGVAPGGMRRILVNTGVAEGATGELTNEVDVSGAGTGQEIALQNVMRVAPPDPFGIKEFEVAPTDAGGAPFAQAGAHPATIATSLSVPSFGKGLFPFGGVVFPAPVEQFKDVYVHLPVGLVGFPTATARCTTAQLATYVPGGNGTIPNCPAESQVGLAVILGGEVTPVYNLFPPPGTPAAFGFLFQGVVVVLRAELRAQDSGIDIVTHNVSTSIPVPEVDVEFWGLPASSSHDYVRHLCLEYGGYEGANGNICPSEAALTPFLRMPTSCPGTPLHWEAEMDTYLHPGTFARKETTTAATANCQDLPFDPSFSLLPTGRAAGAPTGIDVNLSIPQGSSPEGLDQGDLRTTTVTLPEGMTVNPSAADGLAACSDDQLRLGLAGPSQCPDASKLGTVEITTPLLDHAIGGAVLLRSQASSDPASGDLYRLAIELRSDEDGVDLKLPGSIVADPETGRLTATFDDLPQLPFDLLELHLKTGIRAPLTTPPACGSHATHAELTSWSGKTVALDSTFTLDQACDAPGFGPGFQAGVVSPTGGQFSPFLLRVTREARQPNLSRIEADLPEGELAKLAGIPPCPDAAAVTGACPASSSIGTVTVASGDGPSPLFLPQPGRAPAVLYLAGPYRGAPYSVLASVPVQAGPFDLGTVAVRSALRIDPVSTRVAVQSDPLPQVVAGTPVAYRDLRVDVDRPDFAVNPTDCDPKAVDGAITSAQGESVQVSNRFQVGDCSALPFRPKLSLRLKGKVQRRAHPALVATLRARPGEANISRAQVKLPPSALLDQSHIGTICTRVQFAARQCPAASVYGRARAVTPLLDYPLTGNVYLRASSHKLPDLVAELRGPGVDPIAVELAGRTDSVHGALRNTIEAVPDAPVSSFRLELFGGRRGLVELGEGLCRNPRVSVKLDGQNGKVFDTTPELRAACGKASKRHGRRRHRRAR